MADRRASITALRAELRRLKSDRKKLKGVYAKKLEEKLGESFMKGVEFALMQKAKSDKKCMNMLDDLKKSHERELVKKAKLKAVPLKRKSPLPELPNGEKRKRGRPRKVEKVVKVTKAKKTNK